MNEAKNNFKVVFFSKSGCNQAERPSQLTYNNKPCSSMEKKLCILDSHTQN